MDDKISRLKKAITDMDSELSAALVRELMQGGTDPSLIMEEGLMRASKEVADSYDRKEIFLPQVLASVNAFYAALNLLRPSLLLKGPRPGSKVLIGVVEGDIHDIGKNLIRIVMEANGFSCHDLGRDVPTEVFIKGIADELPDYVGISTLMTPTMAGMKDVVDGMVDNGTREGRIVMVGGGPLYQGYADRIGADFYGVNARETIAWLRSRESEERK